MMHTTNVITTFKTVPEIFRESLREYPHCVAIENDCSSVTYAELDQYSDRIAAGLMERGVKQGDMVGTLMERSPELFASWLGILKVGATYVPVDPANPAERIKYIVEDSGMAYLITDQGNRQAPIASLNLCASLHVEELLSERSLISFHQNTYNSDNIAYMIYTSGSTGRPKGVRITDRGIVSLVQNSTYAQLDHTDIIAQASNASFDAITFEVWGALLTGARVVIAPRETILSVERFSAWLVDKNITILFITVAWFNHIARHEPAAFASLKTVLFGGEACNVRWINEVLRAGKPLHLSNIYGPTECTTFSLSYEITEKELDEQQKVPIGKPINHTLAYILDERQQLVPYGVTGELYIGGEGLAAGYWNRPELTAERFVHLPQLADGPLYRTGDLVQRRADGQIDFIGRTDDQIKLRGHRIELGEIEEALRSCPGICEAVAALTTVSGQEEPVLAVYYATEQELEAGQLRDQLQQRLPAYMVPAAWREVESFALTVNGKIDRRQLPPIQEQDLRQQAYQQPDRPGEAEIAAIWADLLNRQQIGAQDHFFAIGGHSLLAAQVVSRMEEQLQRQVTLRALFDYPVLRELAAYVQQQPVSGPASVIPAYVSEDGRYPLSPAQQRLWLVQQLEPDSQAYHIPFAFHLYGILDADRLEQAIHEVVERHDSLRTQFGEESGEPYQQVTGNLPVLERSSLHVPVGEQEQHLQEVLQREAWETLSLTAAPPLRLRLIELEAGHHVLSWVIHH
ncbi:non-ribosomal peptide synthetase, partial [Paenibacillus wulumuqiensis]|uniref:non-ribosomal peptide synthetase n=1 Tax=Paenibacillus wulumuqiensis TaxID=1567107 RepID=UPI000AF1122E